MLAALPAPQLAAMTGLAALTVALPRHLEHRLLADGARQAGFCFYCHEVAGELMQFSGGHFDRVVYVEHH